MHALYHPIKISNFCSNCLCIRTMFAPLFIIFISLWFACSIQSRIVEGLGLCRSWFGPRKCFASWTGPARDLPRILHIFFSFSLQPGISSFNYVILFKFISLHLFSQYICLCPQCELILPYKEVGHQQSRRMKQKC